MSGVRSPGRTLEAVQELPLGSRMKRVSSSASMEETMEGEGPGVNSMAAREGRTEVTR